MATEQGPTAAPPGTTADDVLLSRLISHMQGGDAEAPPAAEQQPDVSVPALAPAKGSKASDQDIEVDGDWKPDPPNLTPQSAPVLEAATSGAAASPAAVAPPADMVISGEATATPGADSAAGSDPGAEVVVGEGGKKLSRRIIANRESAQRSRLRKLQYIADLEANISGLNGQVTKLGPQLAFLRSQHESFERQNDELRTQVAQLLQETQYKDNLNDALRAELARLQGKDGQVEERNSLAASLPTEVAAAASAAIGGISSGGPSISASLPLSVQLALGASVVYPTLPLAATSAANPLAPLNSLGIGSASAFNGTNGGSAAGGEASGFPNLTPSQYNELQTAIASGTLSPDLLAALSALPPSATSAPPLPPPSMLPPHGGSAVLAAAQAAFLAASAASANLPFQTQQLPPQQPALDTVPLPLLQVSSQQVHLQQQQARVLPLPQQLQQSTWQHQPPLQQQQPQQPSQQHQLSAQDLLLRLQGNGPASMAAAVGAAAVGDSAAAAGSGNDNRIKRQRVTGSGIGSADGDGSGPPHHLSQAPAAATSVAAESIPDHLPQGGQLPAVTSLPNSAEMADRPGAAVPSN